MGPETKENAFGSPLHALGPGTVSIDNRRTWERGEELLLCCSIGVHRLVIVEVIGIEIGEDSEIKRNPLYPSLLQSMRRDLHHSRFATEVDHFAKSFVVRNGVMGGEARGNMGGA